MIAKRGDGNGISESTRDRTWVVAGSLAKLAYGIAIFKYIATTIGVAALGDAGQLLSLISILALVSSAGLNRAVAHRHGELSNDPARLDRFNGITAIVVLVAVSVFVAFLWLSAGTVATSLLRDQELTGVVRILAAEIPLLALNGLLIAAASAHGASSRAAKASISSAATGFAVLYIFGPSELNLILYFLVLQIALNTVTLRIALGSAFLREARLTPTTLLASIKNASITDSEETKFMFGFAVAIFVPVISYQANRLSSRTVVANSLGQMELGLWEAASKLQEGYIQLFGSVLVLVLLPELVRNRSSAAAHVAKYWRDGSIVFLGGLLFVIPFGGRFLALVYEPAASQVHFELGLLLTGDLVRAFYIVNQFRFLADERIRAFVLLELLSASTLFGATLVGAHFGTLRLIFVLYLAQGAIMSFTSAITTKAVFR